MTRRLPSFVSPSVAMLLVLLAAGPVQASVQPGDLDSSFSTDGKATIDVTETGTGHDFAHAVWIQSNGKILVAGNATPGSSDVGLARFEADGDPDALFGGGDGAAHRDFGGVESANGVVRSGSRILVAGSTAGDFLIAAFDNEGDLDTSFAGGAGFVTTDLGGTDAISAIALQADGKIVASGYTTSGDFDFAMARYEPDGDLDPTFSSDGIAVTDFEGDQDLGQAVVLQTNGKIVQGGTSGPNDVTGDRFALVRYLADGKRDLSYGTSGRVRRSIGPFSDNLIALARQSDGKIVAAGDAFRAGIEQEDFALARFTTEGQLDDSFDGDGKTITVFPEGVSIARGVAVQSSGKIVAVGLVFTVSDQGDVALARYKPDGSLNATFGDGGRVNTDFDMGSDDAGQAVAIQADGRIVVVGSTTTAANDFAVVRYLST